MIGSPIFFLEIQNVLNDNGLKVENETAAVFPPPR